jgi:hypothetical protein
VNDTAAMNIWLHKQVMIKLAPSGGQGAGRAQDIADPTDAIRFGTPSLVRAFPQEEAKVVAAALLGAALAGNRSGHVDFLWSQTSLPPAGFSAFDAEFSPDECSQGACAVIAEAKENASQCAPQIPVHRRLSGRAQFE